MYREMNENICHDTPGRRKKHNREKVCETPGEQTLRTNPRADFFAKNTRGGGGGDENEHMASTRPVRTKTAARSAPAPAKMMSKFSDSLFTAIYMRLLFAKLFAHFVPTKSAD